jgi:hypothetical protein
VVTVEVSAPGKQRQNRRIPDVCTALGVRCTTRSKCIAHSASGPAGSQHLPEN